MSGGSDLLRGALAAGLIFLGVLISAAPTGPGATTLTPILWGAVGWGLSGGGVRAAFALILLGAAQSLLSGAPVGAYVLLGLVVFSAVSTVAQARLFDGAVWRAGLTVAAFVFGAICLNAIVVLSGFEALPAVDMIWICLANLAVYWVMSPLFVRAGRAESAAL